MSDKVPNEEECMELLKQYNVPENIVRHSIKVKELALQLAEDLERRGIKVNKKLVIAAALLHDLDKAESLANYFTHGEKAYEELKKLGMHKVAEIVKKHVLEAILRDELKTIEEKIVYYADKRVMHDRIVSLDERFAYLRERYGLKDKGLMEIIDKSHTKVIELEKELLGWKKKRD